jgi:Domain of unknown function (DUF1996)
LLLPVVDLILARRFPLIRRDVGAASFLAPNSFPVRSSVFSLLGLVLLFALGSCGGSADGDGRDLSAIARSTGGWLLKCDYSHSLPDDPILFPGQPGASHSHDFLANSTTNAASSYGSMTVGATTCSATSGDTAGYWAPSLYKHGVKIDPAGTNVREQFYYRKDNLKAGAVIQPFPADFRVIAGHSRATSEAENPSLGRELYWGCSDNSETGKPKAPINCATGIITVHVGFPNCWDGVSTDSPDHQSHVVYPSSGVCPADHPVPLPRLIVRLEYPVGPDSSGITLSSGPYYTIHSDFWNTWDQTKLVDLVERCLNTNTDCGTL